MVARRQRAQGAAPAFSEVETPPVGNMPIQKVGPWEEIVTEWEIHLLSRAMAPNTLAAYMESAKQLGEYMEETGGPTDFGWVTSEHIERFLAHLGTTGRKPSTLSVRFRSLRQLFKWARTERIIQDDPMRTMVTPIIPEPSTPILTDEQLKALMKTVRKDTTFEGVRDEAIIRIMLDAGVRRAELLGIRYDPNDPAKNDVEDIRKGVVRVFGKGRRDRSVYIGPKTASALTRYRRHRSQHPQAHLPAFWLSKKGAVTGSGVFQIVQKRGRQAGIRGLHPHMLRHTWAHYFSAGGGRESDLMALAGWRSPQMVRRYGRTAATARALDAARELSLGDRL